MQFQINKKDIKNVIKKLAGVSGGNMLLTVEKGVLSMTAVTDDMIVKCNVPVENATDGTFTVNAQKFTKIINASDGVIHFSCQDETAQIKAMLSKTAFAMDNKEARRFMRGMLFEIGNKTIRCVATDGHRLAIADKKLPATSAVNVRFTLPYQSCIFLMKILDGKSADEVCISALEYGFIRFEVGDMTLISKTISEDFPDYERILGNFESVHHAKIKTDSLKQALVRVSVLATGGVVLLQFSDWKLRISSLDRGAGGADDEVPCEHSEGEFESSFNVAYLLDAVTTIETENTKISFVNDASPCLISPAGDPGLRHLIMPISL